MKSTLVLLFVVGVTIVHAQTWPIVPEVQNTVPVAKHSSTEDGRKSQFFTKTLKKFVVTPSRKNDMSLTTVSTIKRPAMKKIMPKHKTTAQSTFKYEPATRRPMMKLIKFTVKPPLTEHRTDTSDNFNRLPVRNNNQKKTAAFKLKSEATTGANIKKHTVRKNIMLPTRSPLFGTSKGNANKFLRSPQQNSKEIKYQPSNENDMVRSSNKESNSEETIDQSSEIETQMKKKYSSEEDKETSDEDDYTTDSDLSLEDDSVKWDETNKYVVGAPEVNNYRNTDNDDDDNEFIFVNKPTPSASFVSRNLRRFQNKDKDLLHDDTSRVNSKTIRGPQSRQTRSVNIIEEENLGTTISGYKFTGRQTELSHDVGFRNIHS